MASELELAWGPALRLGLALALGPALRLGLELAMALGYASESGLALV